jgi:hypothetical protein
MKSRLEHFNTQYANIEDGLIHYITRGNFTILQVKRQTRRYRAIEQVEIGPKLGLYETLFVDDTEEPYEEHRIKLCVQSQIYDYELRSLKYKNKWNYDQLLEETEKRLQNWLNREETVLYSDLHDAASYGQSVATIRGGLPERDRRRF